VRLRIWGCRGSVPTPGASTVGYGGETSCVEIVLEDEAALVLDAGSGLRRLGLELQQRGIRRLYVLLTHLHLDHIEGLRFFAPLFDEQVEIDVWGPRSPSFGLEERIARSFSPPLFPIDLRRVPARVTFHDVPRDPWTIGGLTICGALVAHPGPTLGFRIDADGSSLAYLPDHEPALAGRLMGTSRDWISGCSIAEETNLLMHDAQYTEEEYGARLGWGHSSIGDAVAFARAVGSERLLLFHHDPSRSDAALDELEHEAGALAAPGEAPPALAREGMVVELP